MDRKAAGKLWILHKKASQALPEKLTARRIAIRLAVQVFPVFFETRKNLRLKTRETPDGFLS
jgi:hypothetical protein